MTEWILTLCAAFWFGILTSISPCPLTANLAAVSFIGRKVGSVKQILLAGLLYSLGRVLTYVILGILLVKGLAAIPELSHALSKYMNLLMGPFLILVAMVLLNLLKLPAATIPGAWTERAGRVTGIWGAFGLGILFALSFCPTSAALFFGSLLPLALKADSPFLLPALYGTATAVPVLAFAFLLAFAANRIGRITRRLAQFEAAAQAVTGWIFLLAGLYWTFTVTFGIRMS